jgi:diguanylate cyclase (GGDEF)-like protein
MDDVRANSEKRTTGRFLLAFVVLVDLVALGVILLLPRAGFWKSPVTLLFMLGLAALTGYRPINVRPLRTTISASDPFLFATIAALGGLPAVVVGLASICSSMIGAKMRLSLTRTPFNLAAAAISIGAASWVFELVHSGNGALQQVLPLTLATTVYFLVNATLVSLAISIEGATSFVTTWKRTSVWTAVTIYCATTVAVALLFVLDVAGPASLVLGIPPLWLFMAYYRSHRDHLREQQIRMEQILEHNQLLEKEVRARTAQLAAKVDELERARNHLRELAHTDELTLLANRRRFQHYLSRELSRSKRFKHEFSVLLIDVDRFKRVNDDYGHPMGDLVLQQLASLVENSVRHTDLAARYGGEEFAVVLAETDKQGGVTLAEQLRRRVEQQVFGSSGEGPGRLTISVGVVSYPDDAGEADELIAMADRRLYQAKAAGRNRVVGECASPAVERTRHR